MWDYAKLSQDAAGAGGVEKYIQMIADDAASETWGKAGLAILAAASITLGVGYGAGRFHERKQQKEKKFSQAKEELYRIYFDNKPQEINK